MTDDDDPTLVTEVEWAVRYGNGDVFEAKSYVHAELLVSDANDEIVKGKSDAAIWEGAHIVFRSVTTSMTRWVTSWH
jgi:hypothetical protein